MAVTSVKKSPPPPPPPKPPAPKPAAPTASAPSTKTPAPMNPGATAVSLAAAAPSPSTPASPTGKPAVHYIDYSKLQKPPATPPSTPLPPSRPDPRDPNNPVKVGTPPQMTDADKAQVNQWYGQLVGEMNNLSSVNRSKAAALTGKDFNNITATTSEDSFVPQVHDFLSNVIGDGQRVAALGKDGATYEQEIKGLKLALSDFQQKAGYTDDQMKAAIDPSTKGLLTASSEEFANSTATLADAAKTYGQRLDGKASELLGAWDQTKHNEQKQSIVDAISTAFSLFANVGIGGNALVQLATKDAAKWTGDASDVWNNLGLRIGQEENLFGSITNTDLQGYKNSTPSATASDLDSLNTQGLTHLQQLADRFHKYVDDYNNQPPPDSGWYIPSV